MVSTPRGPAPAADGAPGLGPWRRAVLPEGFEPFPDDAVARPVGHRFLETAATHADRTAISSPAGTWTYAELADRVRSHAGAIQARLPGPGPAPVALVLTHDGPLVAAILAVIVSGNIVVVLDPLAPLEASAHVLGESGATLLVHDLAHAEQAAALAEAAPGPVATTYLADLQSDHLEVREPGPGDPLMLAFTSGTSGSSKGGIITHGVLMNLIRGATNALGITDRDRMPMLFPTSLAVASYPMFLPLLNGGTLATLDVRSVGLSPVARFLADERITLAYMAPTVVRFLVDALAGHHFPELRMIALGGELVDAEAVRITADLFEPDLIANGFGTTETGVIALYLVDPNGPGLEGTVPAGYPVPDVELLILDDHGEPVPTGTAGEVAVASPYVFTGYWKHPELTAQVLAADPLDREGWSLYRTGDLGRLDEHGALTVLGRLDTKVKVRGRFVVLGDVEADLHDLPEIGDAAVATAERGGVTELVAVVTAAPDTTVDPIQVRARLMETREAYRVPSRWVVVDELPRLPNGKVDRRALLEPPDQPVTPAQALEVEFARKDGPERDRLARQLRDLWELLLPAGVVGLDDDFMHLGGDSLLAAQMLVMFEERTGITVPMGELVHARTIRELVEVILTLKRQGELEPRVVSCVQPGDEAARPRLWFVHDLQGSAYRVRHLAEHLGDDQPVWSFESPLLRGEPNRYSSLDTFAARYVRDLRAAQPEGPYWVGGYSFGGICAYEMARQLRREGEEVELCAVVDVGPGYRGLGWGDRRSPFRPWFGVAKPPPKGSSPRQVLDHYVAMYQRSPKGFARHLMVRSGLARLVDPARFKADLRRHGRVRPDWRLWYAWEEHWKLATKHWNRANTFDGTVDLFWADGTPSADASMGWDPLVKDLRIHRFHGDHEGILEPRGAPALAEALRSVLDRKLDGSFDPPRGP